MCQQLSNNLKEQFIQITDLSCEVTYMEKGENHNPTTLPPTKKGVYVFLLNEDTCFKVGKAGSNSQARWNSHHYNLDRTTPSTFTKSFLDDLDNFKQYFQNEGIENISTKVDRHINNQNFRDWLNNATAEEVANLSNELNLSSWIRENISRIEFTISHDETDFALNLLEALVQFKLNPIYEG